MSRPEHTGGAKAFYTAKEAKGYQQNVRMRQVQRELSKRALELLNIPVGVQHLILDIGCGSGFSHEPFLKAGHVCIGTDINRSMLGAATDRGKRKAALCAAGRGPKKELAEGVSDVVEADMGDGLGFRRNVFDGAISISALQWLCYPSGRHQDGQHSSPRERLLRFFMSLRVCLKIGARAVLQFYPETHEDAVEICTMAQGVGFQGGLVVDYPTNAKGKKYFLVIAYNGGKVVLNKAELLSDGTESKKQKFAKPKSKKYAKKKSLPQFGATKYHKINSKGKRSRRGVD
jgi:18S rRNA (guanine1575-N7)-methyltransferase